MLGRPSFPRLALALLPSSPRSPSQAPVQPRSSASGLEATAGGGRRRPCPAVNLAFVLCRPPSSRPPPSPRSRPRSLRVSTSFRELGRNAAAAAPPCAPPRGACILPAPRGRPPAAVAVRSVRSSPARAGLAERTRLSALSRPQGFALFPPTRHSPPGSVFQNATQILMFLSEYCICSS